MIKIKNVKIYPISQTLKTPFKTNIGYVVDRDSLLVEVIDYDGVSGWGEVVAFSTPWYTEETIKTCYHILTDLLIPPLLGKQLTHPNEVTQLLQPIRRNNMAKASIEGAIWDLYAKKQKLSLSEALGGTKKTIDCGVVVGMSSLKEMLNSIRKHVAEGYKRVKIKISPEKDIEIVREIRRHFPTLPLMADANSSYTLKDIDRLKELDQYHLMMIEQPLGEDDIIDHAKLQDQMKTKICLDESIVSYTDAKKAIELGSCKVINIKPGRVGGLTVSKQIHDLCSQHGIDVWCGGMLETGISRAHNIALASLDNFTIPGDISSSSRYWEEDIVFPEIKVINGSIDIPNEVGLGFEVKRDFLERYKNKEIIN
ncbi:o-succinylbenzoate synthase [Metabacillus sp. HB246100]